MNDLIDYIVYSLIYVAGIGMGVAVISLTELFRISRRIEARRKAEAEDERQWVRSFRRRHPSVVKFLPEEGE